MFLLWADDSDERKGKEGHRGTAAGGKLLSSIHHAARRARAKVPGLLTTPAT